MAIGAFVLAATAEALAEIEVKWHLLRWVSLAYGLTAITAALGLWRMRPWGYVAFVGWVAAVLLVGVSWPLLFSSTGTPWWFGLIWIGLIGAIMVPLARYVRRVITQAAMGTP